MLKDGGKSIMPLEPQSQSKNDELPQAFVYAKWLAYAAVAMTPVLVVITAWKQLKHELIFSFVACAFVPLMAGTGYWFCRLVRLFAIAQRDESAKYLFPSTWPVPFSWFNALHRLTTTPKSRRLNAAITLSFINMFVVLWCGFMLFWVVAGIAILIQI